MANLYDPFLITRYVAASAALVILFLVALVVKKRWLIPRTPIFFLYLLYLLLTCCSLLWATNTAEAVFTASLVTMGFLVTLASYTLLGKRPETFRKTLWIVAAVVLVADLAVAVVQLSQVDDLSYQQLYRVIGLNGHKNLLSVMLFVLSGFLLTAAPFIKNKVLKALPVVGFILSMTLVFLLKSRAVALSALIAIAVFGLLLWLHRRKVPFSKTAETATLVVTLVLAVAFVTLGLRWFAHRNVPHTAERSQVETQLLSTSSLVERCLIWDKTYRIADQRPLLGHGAGNWQVHFPDAGLKGLYRTDLWNVSFTKPHNEYLGVLAELGYPGLLLYLAFLVALILRSFFALCRTSDRHDFLSGAIVLSLFVGCCVNACFDFPNSRVEHLCWMGVFTAVMFRCIAQKPEKALHHAWNLPFLCLSVLMLVVGVFRFHGEMATGKMQQAMKAGDWQAMRRYSADARSVFYTLDPVGQPLRWYQGKAEKRLNDPQSLASFREAHHDAPFNKEVLNDLGLAEYHDAHNTDGAICAFEEAIRISPNYLYPYLNLAYLYLAEHDPGKARDVAERIDFDETKRDILLRDAPFFEPDNVEAVRQKIEADYHAVLQLRSQQLGFTPKHSR